MSDHVPAAHADIDGSTWLSCSCGWREDEFSPDWEDHLSASVSDSVSGVVERIMAVDLSPYAEDDGDERSVLNYRDEIIRAVSDTDQWLTDPKAWYRARGIIE